jgi:hypothetical protein
MSYFLGVSLPVESISPLWLSDSRLHHPNVNCTFQLKNITQKRFFLFPKISYNVDLELTICLNVLNLWIACYSD